MNWNQAQWTNGTETISGYWRYCRSLDLFYINLDSVDPITGQKRRIETHNDQPEWGKWKLIERQSA